MWSADPTGGLHAPPPPWKSKKQNPKCFQPLEALCVFLDGGSYTRYMDWRAHKSHTRYFQVTLPTHTHVRRMDQAAPPWEEAPHGIARGLSDSPPWNSAPACPLPTINPTSYAALAHCGATRHRPHARSPVKIIVATIFLPPDHF